MSGRPAGCDQWGGETIPDSQTCNTPGTFKKSLRGPKSAREKAAKDGLPHGSNPNTGAPLRNGDGSKTFVAPAPKHVTEGPTDLLRLMKHAEEEDNVLKKSRVVLERTAIDLLTRARTKETSDVDMADIESNTDAEETDNQYQDKEVIDVTDSSTQSDGRRRDQSAISKKGWRTRREREAKKEREKEKERERLLNDPTVQADLSKKRRMKEMERREELKMAPTMDLPGIIITSYV